MKKIYNYIIYPILIIILVVIFGMTAVYFLGACFIIGALIGLVAYLKERISSK